MWRTPSTRKIPHYRWLRDQHHHSLPSCITTSTTITTKPWPPPPRIHTYTHTSPLHTPFFPPFAPSSPHTQGSVCACVEKFLLNTVEDLPRVCRIQGLMLGRLQCPPILTRLLPTPDFFHPFTPCGYHFIRAPAHPLLSSAMFCHSQPL